MLPPRVPQTPVPQVLVQLAGPDSGGGPSLLPPSRLQGYRPRGALPSARGRRLQYGRSVSVSRLMLVSEIKHRDVRASRRLQSSPLRKNSSSRALLVSE
ncbi:hypothetical protein NDU88_001584 [Pleurodeles waltl]|uniref:Uncharacterized protein n=1 Tax=Pleurodeles waltl TaxID=8319 RepID=A0AAV7W1G4_PLEWA|nr:hypothetical protein NDU88_001584 [Pleurodeles waltl]